MKFIAFITLFMLLFACKKDKLGPQCISCTTTPTNTSSNSVIIINEGNFGFGNATISIYNENTQQVSQNVFQQKNALPLGDVAQSFTQINNKGYIVVNNSNKVEVVNITDFSSIATITGFTSPRYFLPINSNKAYVTDLYSNTIQVVDLNTNTITKNITVNGWTEQLLSFNDTAYVCDMTNNNLLLFNTITDTFIDSIKVGKQPNSLVMDKNNKIWILCDGGINQSNAQLVRFNPMSRNIEKTFTFSAIAASPSELKINGTKNKMYFINSSVYQINITDTLLPTNPLINNNGQIFYGLGINPTNNTIYVSNAIDYVQNGIIYSYDSLGTLNHQFQAGIIPGAINFVQ